MNPRVSITGLLVVWLAVWRITHLLWGEDGPGDIFVRLRKLAGQGFFGSLLDCFYCLSLWIAIPFAWWLGAAWWERVVLWFAISGGAILLERVTAEKPPAAPAAKWTATAAETPPDKSSEDQSNAMLR